MFARRFVRRERRPELTELIAPDSFLPLEEAVEHDTVSEEILDLICTAADVQIPKRFKINPDERLV